jgi:hypothetical protein
MNNGVSVIATEFGREVVLNDGRRINDRLEFRRGLGMTGLGLQGQRWQVEGLLLGESRPLHVIPMVGFFILENTISGIRCCG